VKIGITGGNGFIGWHLRCYLKTLEQIQEVRVASRATFSNPTDTEEFVDGLDAVVHLAGVNRAGDDELLTGNAQPALALVSALRAKNDNLCIIYASSTYAESATNAYGKGKAEAGKILKHWGEMSGSRVVNMIIPHVFGEYGRPFYNSAMATFCHQITSGEKVSVNSDGNLELIHVQDLVEMFFQAIEDDTQGDVRITGYGMSVVDAVNRLTALYVEYRIHNRFPDLSDKFERNLFNSLRGFISNDARIVTPKKHSDDRGWLVETIKAGSGGQCFVSTTKPGITRGNHFHRRKVERFFVLQGKAEIKIRRLFTNEVVTYALNGDEPSFVDIPTLHTHSITNVGNQELITLFWADEFFDPENPDTYFESIE